MRFEDRTDAGRQLAARLTSYAHRHDVVVLALPRGGVPVASEVARALAAPMDVFLVRKLGVPGHPELAMGAIAIGGVRVLSDALIDELGIPPRAVDEVSAREHVELARRNQLYRGDRALPDLSDRTAIVIDDGLATGATMEAAVAALRQLHAARVVVAVPVGASESCARLSALADEVVCLATPEPFRAVGLWYERFDQVSDEEVIALLRSAGGNPAGHDGPGGSLNVTTGAVGVIRERAVRLDGSAGDYDRLLASIGDARLVLIGEASHGTHDFYRERAVITERLIAEREVAAVAVEADWPDAYRVNRYVRGASSDDDAVQALADFGRFPTWMWRNTAVVEFVAWLRAHNATQPRERRTGFYGIDLYSLRASMEAVLAYLDKVDPDAARRARTRYGCFDQFADEPGSYGYGSEDGLTGACEDEAVHQLLDLQHRRAEYAVRDGRVGTDEFFFAEQNARLVRSAEEYYRTMFRGRSESWNVRDRHMTDTLGELVAFLDRTFAGRARLVVWAHNSHLGDARATEMGDGDEVNVGQLVRERWGANEVALIGFTTHAGTVTAASSWGQPPARKAVRPSMAGSYERLFHDAGIPRFLLPLRDDLQLAEAVTEPRLERAIGVVYAPRTERLSHYFTARLASQFDFVIHLDETRALEPLERTAGWEACEPADTFPSGL